MEKCNTNLIGQFKACLICLVQEHAANNFSNLGGAEDGALLRAALQIAACCNNTLLLAELENYQVKAFQKLCPYWRV